MQKNKQPQNITVSDNLAKAFEKAIDEQINVIRDQYEDELDSASDNIETLTEQIEKNEQMVNKHQQEMEKMKAELEQIKGKLQLTEKSAENLTKEVKEQRDHVDTLQIEKAESHSQVEIYQGLNTSLEKKIEILTQELKILQAETTKKDKELALSEVHSNTLEEKLTDMSNRADTAEKINNKTTGDTKKQANDLASAMTRAEKAEAQFKLEKEHNADFKKMETQQNTNRQEMIDMLRAELNELKKEKEKQYKVAK